MSVSFKIVAILLICGIFVNIVPTLASWFGSDDEDDSKVDTEDDATKENDRKLHVDENNLPTILWWDGISDLDTAVTQCPIGPNCTVSYDRSLLHKDDVMVYAFFGSRFLTNGLPLPRKPGDLWALMHETSPHNSDWLISFESTMELFNYTSTFNRKSHFPITTHWLRSINALETDKHLVKTEVKNKLRKEGLAPVVLINSICDLHSSSERYIKLLQEHIEIDSYGACLHNKAFPKEHSRLNEQETYWSDEYLKFIAQYKFIIAFEDTICDDYITDKLWRPLEAGTVPIVMGSPKLKDFLPSDKSAIITQDFKTVKDLAELIKTLDKDDTKYEQYLEFKHKGISNVHLLKEIDRMTPDGVHQTFMTGMSGYQCMLCDKLHDARAAVKSGQPIPPSQATRDHFGCALPTHKLDEDGESFVPDTDRHTEFRFYKINAELFRQSYDKGENITALELNHLAIMRLTEVEHEENRVKQEL